MDAGKYGTRHRAHLLLETLLGGALVLAGCQGVIMDPSADKAGPRGPNDPLDPNGGVEALRHPAGLGPTEIPRLTRAEYRATVAQLTGIDVSSQIDQLPVDSHSPFDNGTEGQAPSAALVQGLSAIAGYVADQLGQDGRWREVVPCEPSGPGDSGCFEAFVVQFGRQALRRPLAAEEVSELAALQTHAEEAGDFGVGVGMVVAVLLQDLELVYRMEIGTPTEATDVVVLTPFELLTRMSYLLWGTPPDQALLDRASELASAEGRRAMAREMLSDPRAAERIARFHAMWLGYESSLADSALGRAMREESDALVRRVVFDERTAWTDLFRAEETWVNSELAAIYELMVPEAGEAWVPYEGRRRGILSHASFLSTGVKQGRTSPVLRGIAVRERLFCQEIPLPPPEVNADEPPGGEEAADACKVERYAIHRDGSCASCHRLLDPVGFGLERFDPSGRYRTHDDGRPDCEIPEQGELVDLGLTFRGPGELGESLVESGTVQACISEQLLRFATGRNVDGEHPMVDALAQTFTDRGERFDDLLVELVASEAFAHRQMREME